MKEFCPIFEIQKLTYILLGCMFEKFMIANNHGAAIQSSTVLRK